MPKRLGLSADEYISREFAQAGLSDGAELISLLHELRSVQEELAKGVVTSAPLSQYEARKYLYNLYKNQIKNYYQLHKPLPVNRLVEEYNRLVSRLGIGTPITGAATIETLQEHAKRTVEEAYRANIAFPSRQELFERRTELLDRLYSEATAKGQRGQAVQRVLADFFGLVPVEELSEVNLWEGGLFKFFRPLPAQDRASVKGVLRRRLRPAPSILRWRNIQAYFPYDIFNYTSPDDSFAVRQLMRAAQEASINRTSVPLFEKRTGIRVLDNGQVVPQDYWVPTGVPPENRIRGRWRPGQRRYYSSVGLNIWKYTQAPQETGLPGLKLNTSQVMKNLVESERRGFRVREAISELADREYFNRKFARRRGYFDVARHKILESNRPRQLSALEVRELLDRELVERRTGLRYRVTAVPDKAGSVTIVPILDSPLDIEVKHGFSTVGDFLEAFKASEETVNSEAMRQEAEHLSNTVVNSANKAIQDIRSELLGIDKFGPKYATRIDKLGAFWQVRKALSELPSFRGLLAGKWNVDPEEFVQQFQEEFIRFADEWITAKKVTRVTDEVSRAFLKDWMNSAGSIASRALLAVRGIGEGIGSDQIAEAYRLLARLVPAGMEIFSEADIETLRAQAQRVLSPMERETLAPLLDLMVSELPELKRLYIAKTAQASLYDETFNLEGRGTRYLIDRLSGVLWTGGKEPSLSINKLLQEPFPKHIWNVEQLNTLGELARNEHLGISLMYKGAPVRMVREISGITEWEVLSGPLKGKLLRFGSAASPISINPEDIPERFSWGGYQGTIATRYLADLEAPTAYFRDREGIIRTLENTMTMREGQLVTVFDLETTTLPDLVKDRPELFGITQVAAQEYRVKGGRLVPTSRGPLNVLVRPSQAMEVYVQGLLGRSDLTPAERQYLENTVEKFGLEAWRGGVVTADDALWQLVDYASSSQVLMGQNVTGFDLPLIENRYGFDLQQGRPVIDTQAIGAYLGSTARTDLPALVERYGTKEVRGLYAAGAHNALTDIQAAAGVFNSMQWRVRRRFPGQRRIATGDYLVRFMGGHRGVYRVLNYSDKEPFIEMLRVDTGQLATLAGSTFGDLENQLYSQFYYLGKRYKKEVDRYFNKDRASRMVRRGLASMTTAEYYMRNYEALEAYADLVGKPLTEIGELRTQLYRKLPEEQAKILAAMSVSELRNYQEAYQWFRQEYGGIHRQLVTQLNALVSEGKISERYAHNAYNQYINRLSELHPFGNVTRVPAAWEQRVVLPGLVAGEDAVLQVGRRQWSEASLRNVIRRYTEATRGSGDAEAFIKHGLVPALKEAGVAVPEGVTGVPELAEALSAHRVSELIYEDVLAPRTSERFISDARSLSAQLLRRSMAEAGGTVSPRWTEELKALPVAPLAGDVPRYTMIGAWGLEGAAATARRLFKSAGLPVLALGAAYLGFQMLRNDPLDLGENVSQYGPYNQVLPPDMRLNNPPAPIAVGGVRMKVRASHDRAISQEGLATMMQEAMNEVMPVPVNMSVNISDNTARLTTSWYQQRIADAVYGG